MRRNPDMRDRRNVRKARAPRDALPLRAFYRIGEAASWLGVEAHVVRFWQEAFAGEFGAVIESKGGQRVFTRRQVLLLGVIRELLYVELYTVAGAKRQLRLAAERERAKAAG